MTFLAQGVVVGVMFAVFPLFYAVVEWLFTRSRWGRSVWR